MSFSRRRFIGGAVLGGVVRLVGGSAPAGCGAGQDETRFTVGAGEPLPPGPRWPAAGSDSPFRHGVASGDPLTDAVILWTRVSPEQGQPDSVEVEWRVAEDPDLTELVSSGTAYARVSSDYTVHVDVRALAAGTTYYYQFRALGRTSRVGRTKTLPDGAPVQMRFGVASCSNYPAGFFNAYARLAEADLDLVLHLGDYIYEYPDGVLGDGAAIGRAVDPPHELLTLADYRTRHAQYKTDPDLQELHRQHPMISAWDDHEIANNVFRDGAQNHQSSEGEFAARKQSARQAYFEWMPVRSGPLTRLYRAFACGDLCDLLLLDTRLEGRDVQARPCEVSLLEDPSRHMLGAEQESWLRAQLQASQARGARFRLIGQQVMFAPLLRSPGGCVQKPDSWDGYPLARERLLSALDELGVENVVVLTGDAHSSWAIDVAEDPFNPETYDPVTGRGSRLVEFVAPAVSSPAAGADAALLLETHPHVKFTDQMRQGYLLIDVTPERVQAEWHFVASVREQRGDAEIGAMFQARAGEARVIDGAAASSARLDRPAPAP